MPRRSISRTARSTLTDFHPLSLRDLLEARDLYQLHLTERKGVLAAWRREPIETVAMMLVMCYGKTFLKSFLLTQIGTHLKGLPPAPK